MRWNMGRHQTSNLGVRGSNPFRRAIEFFKILVLYERGQRCVFGARMCCLGAPANRVIFVNEWPWGGW